MMMTVLAHISDSLTTAINGVVRKNMRLASLAKTLIIITNFSFLMTNLCACSTIDDDLSNCHNAELDYELRLVTNMTTELKTELQTELSTQADLQMAAALQSYLKVIFTDFAHDVDLSFYDTEGDSLRLQHDQHVMDANQASYTLNLPMRHYMHLASANIVDNPVVTLVNDERCHTACLRQPDTDTIASHTTGVFTARQPMEVLENVNQTFDVKLYIANCATTFVVDTVGAGLRDLKVYTTGFATGFNIADSTFLFKAGASPVVRTIQVPTDDNKSQMAFSSVSFPSPEVPHTRSVIDTDDPFISPDAAEALWEIHVYATTADGSITRTKFYVKKPLRAGQLKLIKAKASANGSMETPDPTIGINVTLHWNEGGHYNHEL